MMKPLAEITALSLVLCLGNYRNDYCITKQIGFNERNASFQHGHKENIMKVKREVNPQKVMRSNKTAERLIIRKIELKNTK